MRVNVAADRVLQVSDGFEDAASDFAPRDGREEPFDGVEPRGGGRREMERPSRMTGQPFHDVGMLVGGVVVDDGVDELAGGDRSLDGVEETDELLMAMPGHAAPDHGSIEDVEGGEQRRRAVALVIVGHRPALAGLDRQARLGAVEGLDLALFVNGDDDGVHGRVHVEADDVFDLLRELGIVGAFECAQAMRLETMRVPQALDGAQRNADGLGHGAARPMGGFVRRFRARQRQHFRDDLGGERRAAGLARLVAQKALHPFLAVALLPAPDRRSADAGAASHFQHRQTLGRKENDPRALNMLEPTTAIAGDGEQALAIFGREKDVDGLGHKARLAHAEPFVNPMSASVH